jgi:hypothetical protein
MGVQGACTAAEAMICLENRPSPLAFTAWRNYTPDQLAFAEIEGLFSVALDHFADQEVFLLGQRFDGSPFGHRQHTCHQGLHQFSCKAT